ncbi:MAG TPA: hypothetical protein VI643_08365 [Planctomycetota bacterium]|nr:hypothetical protein [Planctomycetota bacterium]
MKPALVVGMLAALVGCSAVSQTRRLMPPPGGPVTDGLQLAAWTDTDAVPSGSALSIHCRLTNVGSPRDVVVPSPAASKAARVFAAIAGEESDLWQENLKQSGPSIRLDSGSSVTFDISVRAAQHPQTAMVSESEFRRLALRPGRYTVQARYWNGANQPPVTSNSVELRITEASSSEK